METTCGEERVVAVVAAAAAVVDAAAAAADASGEATAAISRGRSKEKSAVAAGAKEEEEDEEEEEVELDSDHTAAAAATRLDLSSTASASGEQTAPILDLFEVPLSDVHAPDREWRASSESRGEEQQEEGSGEMRHRLDVVDAAEGQSEEFTATARIADGAPDLDIRGCEDDAALPRRRTEFCFMSRRFGKRARAREK